MDQIQHKYVEARGFKHHIAEIGTGDSVVVFLHGFPEIWYSWRYQMIAVAKAGFRAIAPDFRGYGLTDVPPDPENSSFDDLVEDVLAVLDALNIPKVFLVAKDFGGRPAYHLALLHPERVIGVVSVCVPYFPGGALSFDGLPEGFYISRWKEPGRAEADFGRFDLKTVIRNIYILFARSEIPIADEGKEIMDMVDPSTPLPSWFSEEDLANYAALYERNGLQAPLQVPYRSLKGNYTGVSDPILQVPALLIMGMKDYLLKFPGAEGYITSGVMKQYAPNMEVEFLAEGTHFVQEQFPDQVNQLIITFLSNHK